MQGLNQPLNRQAHKPKFTGQPLNSTPLEGKIFFLLLLPFTDDFDISNYVIVEDAAQRLLDCIATLPEIYKTTFELRYVHELGNPEIAEILDISAKTVSMRIARAKVMLQEMLEKGGERNKQQI